MKYIISFYLDDMSKQNHEQFVSGPLEIVLKNDDVFSFHTRRPSYFEKNLLQEIIDISQRKE